MKKSKVLLNLMVVFTALLSSCNHTSTPTLPPPASTNTSTSVPTTNTPEPTTTFTPSPTPLPGTEVFPLDSVAREMPWMPLDKNARPAVNYVGFNTKRPPFSNPLVRQAFAAAIDRQMIADMARGYYQENVRPATTLTPPEVLGRDLYNSVGMVFDPEKAKNLFIQAGFEDPSKFPETTFMINSYGDTAPGARLNMVNKMVEMWKNYLGVEINVEVIYYRAEYSKLLSEGHGELYWLGWVADFNDPDNFLRGIFYTGSEYNYGMYTSTEFDQLVDDSLISISPEKRQRLYIEAETLLCQTDAALIPLYFFTYY